MDSEDGIVSTLNQQQEEFRHIQSLALRFLQAILALLAVGLVFARQEWIDYFLGNSVPDTNYAITCPSGGQILNLPEFAVGANGYILHYLMGLSIVLIGLGGVWAARVQFLPSPNHVPNLGYMQTRINAGKLKRAKRFLEIAYFSVGLGILFIALTAIGYVSFYELGEAYVMWFDAIVIIFLIYFFIRITTHLLSKSNHIDILIAEVKDAGILINLVALAGLFLSFGVLRSSWFALSVWLNFSSC